MPAYEPSTRLTELFLQELDERLRDFDSDLLALEAQPSASERADVVNRLFRGAHSLKGAASAVGASAIEVACHELEDFLGALREGTVAFGPAHADVMLKATDGLREAGRQLTGGGSAPAGLTNLCARLTAASTTPAAPERTPAPPAAVPAAAIPVRDGTLRVAADKIDGLLQQNGELLVARLRIETLHAEIAQAAALAHRIRIGTDQRDALRELERTLERLTTAAQSDRIALEHIAADLDAGLRSLRMLPFATACDGLDRIVRDASKASGKRVALEISGGDIGLDRTIVERVRDPLVHLVRNAIDHGIEDPATRIAGGKPAEGTVRLSAALHAGRVEVVVSDDGRGIDRAALRRRARERGLELSDAEDAASIVFMPGISTAAAVTGRSGRGVGLDAVRTEIEAIRGTVSVASEPNAGTRFTLTLPFTLTTMRVVLFRVGAQTYALNSAWITRFVRIDPARVASVQGRPVVLVEADALPLVACADVLGIDDAGSREPAAAIVIDALGTPLALAVDDVIDERDVVFRSLGPRLLALKHVSGASILGDGSLALILRGSVVAEDAVALAQRSRRAPVAVSAPAAPKRILLVDDSVTTRALERSILEAAGYDVATAADGDQAWQLLEADAAVDLVVSDVDMPRMDGFALVSAIRGSSRLREVPVILVTARESDADRQRGLDAGADAYIVKGGFRQEALLDAIEELV